MFTVRMLVVLCCLCVLSALVSSVVSAADRGSADAYLVSAPNRIKERKYKTLEDMCKRALQSDDTCPNAHFHLGICYEKDNKAREAFKEFQTAANIATKEKDNALASKASA